MPKFTGTQPHHGSARGQWQQGYRQGPNKVSLFPQSF